LRVVRNKIMALVGSVLIRKFSMCWSFPSTTRAVRIRGAMLIFNVAQLKEYLEREESYGLECSLNQGTFDKSKLSSGFESPSNYSKLKTSSVPRIPTTTGVRTIVKGQLRGHPS